MNDRVTLAGTAAALGVSKQAVAQRAARECWPFIAENVRGGQRRLYPLDTLPAEIRTAVIGKRTEALIVSSSPAATAGVLPAASPSLTPAGLLIPQACADLTDHQRLERDARAGVVAAIRRFQVEAGCSQEAAMQTLLALAASGRADPVIVKSLQLARDGRGRKGSGAGLPSTRTLKRWLAAPDLTPHVPQRDLTIPPWAKSFLERYQQPQKPSIEAAYRDACNAWSAAERPSIHQVRRFLDKLGTVTRERGRMGPRELKNIQPFIRRDFSHLEPNDIWTADGHCYDAEVQHPLHGRPFRPEITAILDIATRRCVGWSIDLAESGTAVADAIRYAAEKNGIPAIFYVDNGSGYQNAMMKDETTGLMARLGTDMRHSIAYNSQARGVIERAHQTIFVQSAKQLPSYIGAAMDREARLAQFKVTRKALKGGGAIPLIPFDVFIGFIDARVADYNAKAHRALKGTSPDLAWRAFEARGWQAHTLKPGDIDTLFRPRVTRTIQRAEINLFTNIYFARELAEFHGIDAQIAYDIHDPTRIWVYTPEGRFICEAQANGNRRHYMPVPVVQQARERRAKGRLARVDAKRDEILEELHGAPALAAPMASQIVLGGRVIDAAALAAVPLESTEICTPVTENALVVPESRPSVPVSRSERTPADNYADWRALDARLQAGEQLDEADARWHRMYPASAQYRAEAQKKKAAA
jgi:putative transposase